MSAEEWGELYPVARSAARQVAQSYAGFVDEDDLAQEAMLWLLAHPKRVEHHRLPDGSLYERRLALEVITSRLGKVAREERAQVAGEDPEDRYTYSVKMVELLLPHVFQSTVPQTVEYSDSKSVSDPAERGNFMAMVMDVRRAMETVCDQDDRVVLFAHLVGGKTFAWFGEHYSRSGEWWRLRYHDALRRLSVFLSDGVTVESDPDAELLAEALEAAPVAPALEGDPDEDEWRTVGRDPYREPDY